MAYPGDQRSQFITPALSDPLANMYTPNLGGGSFASQYGGNAPSLFGPTNTGSQNSNLFGGMGSMANYGTKPTPGMGITMGGIGAAAGLALGAGNLFLGFKQYGLAKKQLKFARNSFNKNYAANRQITNSSLRDRQSARVASNSGAYQSVGDYMNQNQVAA